MGDAPDVCAEGFWKTFSTVTRVHHWKNYIFFTSAAHRDFKWANSCCNSTKIWKRSALVVRGYKECLLRPLGKKMLLFGTVTNSWEPKSWWSLTNKTWYIKGTEVGRFLRYKIIMASLKVAVRARPLNNRWNIMIRYFTNIFVSGICFDVTQCAC